MLSNLNSWKKNWALMRTFYTGDEIATVAERLKKLKINTLVFCSFESRFARSGGLAAVTMNILPFLKEVNNIPSLIPMTPLYSKIMDESTLESASASFNVIFNKKSVSVEIFEYAWNYEHPFKSTLKEYY